MVMLESRTPKKPAHTHAPVEHKQRMFVLMTVNGTPARFTEIPNQNRRVVVDIILHQSLEHSTVTTTQSEKQNTAHTHAANTPSML